MLNPDQPPTLRDTVAAHLDASEKVRNDWRDMPKFRSVRGSAAAIVAAVGNTAVIYAQAEPLTHKMPHYLAMAVLVFACFWSMFGTLTKQPNLNPPEDRTE